MFHPSSRNGTSLWCVLQAISGHFFGHVGSWLKKHRVVKSDSPEENIDLSLLLKPNSIRSSICGWGIICCIAVSISSHQRHMVFVLRFQCLQHFQTTCRWVTFPITLLPAPKLRGVSWKLIPVGAWTVGPVLPVPLKTYRPQSAARFVRKEGAARGKRWETLRRWKNHWNILKYRFSVDILVCLDIWD